MAASPEVPRITSIPAELLAFPQWVRWRWQTRGGKRTKVPIDARTGRAASVTNPATWAPFDTVAQSSYGDGIGFVMTAADPYLGVDIDHCRTPDGTLDPFAESVVRKLNSYTESTPSGSGIRVWIKASNPGNHHKKPLPGGLEGMAIEIYDDRRYFTVTGEHLPGTPSTIEERQAELDSLYADLFPRRIPPATSSPAPTSYPRDVEEILAKARNAKNGEAFDRLWSGDTSGQGGDKSAADLALCRHLAFWTNRDAEEMDRLFRRSGLFRAKWERPDYRDRTIAKAIDGTSEAYTGQHPGHGTTEPTGFAAFQSSCDALAALPEVEYERCRKKRAQELGVRVGFLDGTVTAIRQENHPEPEGPLRDTEPWPEPVDGSALLEEIYATVRRFISLSEHKARTITLWSIHTHAIDAASVTPILALTSPLKRCGKSTTMALVSKLCARALIAANISPAAVYRAVEAWHPTLLIDEADSFLRDNEELRGVLNSGHTRDTAFVIRMEKRGERFEPRQFTTWAPKAIALIGRLPDTLADRSVDIALERRLPTEQIEKLRHADPGLFDRLARQAARWAADHIDALQAARPAIPGRLHNRAADNWEPLLAIADEAGGDWPKLARGAALALSGEEAAVEGDSLASRLLRDLRPIVEAEAGGAIPTATLIEKLTAIEDSPWGEVSKGDAISPRKLAELLKPFGIKPKKVRVGPQTPYGYSRGQLQTVVARYLGAELEHPEQPHDMPIQADPEGGPWEGLFRIDGQPGSLQQADVPDVPVSEGELCGEVVA